MIKEIAAKIRTLLNENGYATASDQADYYLLFDYGINPAFEDCTICLNLIRNGINLIDCSSFHATKPEMYGQTDKDIIDNITYHHISDERMYTLYEYLK